MPFNDERLARAIRAGRLPVVSGVGHETDTTIADLAADRRAATPSAAAELAVPDSRRLGAELGARRARLGAAARQELSVKRGVLERQRLRLDSASPLRRLPSHRQELDLRAERLRAGLLASLTAKRRHLDAATARFRLASPGQRVALERQRLGGQRRRLARVVGEALVQRRQEVRARRDQLEALSPLRVLERGYSITMEAASGAVLTDPARVRSGQRLRTRLAQGLVISTVESTGSTDQDERMYDNGHDTLERG
jgi:exodeoxyribonuclease VII large subunit